MNILELSPDILKDLIFEHLLIEATNNKYSNDHFSFKWNEDKSSIIYEDIDYIVDGNSCWEDSEQTEKYTSIVKPSDFGEFFNSFLIKEYKIENLHKDNITDQYLHYLENYKSEYDYWEFISEHTRQEDEDCYYNYNRVKTLSIHVEQILNHLKNLYFLEDLKEVKSIFHHLNSENLETIVQFNHLDNKLPEKNIRSKKFKI